jgi:mannitol/fructose-specific phosphotransferase system IIA component (Ntr-type)
MKLQELVPENAIKPQLESTDRDAVLAELLDLLIHAGAVEADARDELLESVIARENRGSTGFGKGVAVPHVKHDDAQRMAAAVGVSQSGVDFNALDKQPVYSFILLLSPASKPDEHLQAMETIFKNLSQDTFRRFLRQASTKEEVVSLLEETDSQHLTG